MAPRGIRGSWPVGMISAEVRPSEEMRKGDFVPGLPDTPLNQVAHALLRFWVDFPGDPRTVRVVDCATSLSPIIYVAA